MTATEFDALVERGIAKLPGEFRRKLTNVVFVVEKEPPQPDLLGLYQGRPLTQRSVMEPFSMPDTITIYQGTHERMAQDEEHLEKIVAETVWHEVAHYFGLNEGEVRRAERRREAIERQRTRKTFYNRDRKV